MKSASFSLRHSTKGQSFWEQEGKVIMYDIARSRLTALEEELLTVGSYYIQTESLRKNTNDKVRIAVYSELHR